MVWSLRDAYFKCGSAGYNTLICLRNANQRLRRLVKIQYFYGVARYERLADFFFFFGNGIISNKFSKLILLVWDINKFNDLSALPNLFITHMSNVKAD